MLKLRGGGGGKSKSAATRAGAEDAAREAQLAAEVASLSPADTDAIFDALDANYDGSITLAELQAYLMARDSWCTATEVADLFAALDANQDGVLSRAELRAGLVAHSSGLRRVMALRPPPAGVGVFADLVRASPICEDGHRGEPFCHPHRWAGQPWKSSEKELESEIYKELGRERNSAPWKEAQKRMTARLTCAHCGRLLAEHKREACPVEIPKAEERAISLRQLKATYAHAQRRCAAEGWVGKRFPGGAMRYVKLSPKELNLYDVATHVILPATHGHTLPDGVTRPSFVELLADGAQRPAYFASHYWAEPVEDFIACIARHTRDRKYGGGGVYGPDGEDALIWVCAYANRQWNLGGDVTDDPSDTSFHRAIRLSRGTIAIVDKEGGYFERVWCDYEIFVSLKIRDEERAEDRRGERYTLDIYTAHNRYGEAVGLVDGVAAVDEVNGAEYVAKNKADRESAFPPSLLHRGITARLQDGKASVEADRRHILNCIRGADDLNAAVEAEHPKYEEINAVLHGRVAAVSLQPAIEAGGAMLDDALAALAASEVTRVGVHLQATAEVMERVQAALPASLEELSLLYRYQLTSLPRLSALTRLRTLDLRGCERLTSLPDLSALTQLQKLKLGDQFGGCGQLASLPDLSALTQLQTLDLWRCEQLASLPDLSALTQLQTLDLWRCEQLASLPDLSALTQLQTLNLSTCKQLASLPDLSALTQLQTLKLGGCGQLTSLPDLSALTQLRTLNLSACKQLASLPDLSALTQLQTLDLGECDQLTSLPDLSVLTQLQKLDLFGCKQLASLPELPPQLTKADIPYLPDHLK